MDVSKYKGLFLQETRDRLSGIEKNLLDLEKGQREPSVDTLFRHYHSIKGMSASMGYEPIKRLAHAQEDLLGRIRSKALEPGENVTELLFTCLDKLKELVARVEEDRPLGDDVGPYIDRIRSLSEGGPHEEKKAPAPPPPAAAKLPELRLSGIMKIEGRVFDDLLASVGDLLSELSTLKMLSQALRSAELKNRVYDLGKTVGRLREDILNARMLPVSELFESLPRVIRDASAGTGKTVNLKIEGDNLTLDKAVLENLCAPLVHLIRNAVDHGIEAPQTRGSAGKPAEGLITIRVAEKRGRVVISVSDDGRGVDLEKIKTAAAAMSIPPEKLGAMGERELLDLLMLPGFSTSEKVTLTSGRGVGLDVVKSAVESLGGSVSIQSVQGSGASFQMELPRTTSIIKGLIVSVRDELFLMPLSRINRVVAEDGEPKGAAFMYGGRKIPLVSLSEVFVLPHAKTSRGCAIIIVEGDLREDTGQRSFLGIEVDGYGDEVDAFVKPLGPPISKLWGVSGISIMGDGSPVFVLDLQQFFARFLGR